MTWNYNKNLALPEHLQYIINTAKKLIQPEKIYLFGSRARGDARPDSDFDLAFVFNNKESWPQFVTNIQDDTPSLYKYDCLDFELLDQKFKDKILNEGVILYECGH